MCQKDTITKAPLPGSDAFTSKRSCAFKIFNLSQEVPSVSVKCGPITISTT